MRIYTHCFKLYVLHFTLTNVSTFALTDVTNGFSYNHYFLFYYTRPKTLLAFLLDRTETAITPLNDYVVSAFEKIPTR